MIVTKLYLIGCNVCTLLATDRRNGVTLVSAEVSNIVPPRISTGELLHGLGKEV